MPAAPSPRRSRRVIGQSVKYDARPANDSETDFIRSRSADPVRREASSARRDTAGKLAG